MLAGFKDFDALALSVISGVIGINAGMHDGAVFPDDIDEDLFVTFASLRGELVADNAGVELSYQAALLLVLRDVVAWLLVLDVELRDDIGGIGMSSEKACPRPRSRSRSGLRATLTTTLTTGSGWYRRPVARCGCRTHR